jgi:hypothetical protein
MDLIGFEKEFSTEEQCREYLYKLPGRMVIIVPVVSMIKRGR